jgi:hypothetical protein
MKYVKLERPKLWWQVQTGLVPSGGRGLQVAVRWWILMTGVMVCVKTQTDYTQYVFRTQRKLEIKNYQY